MIHKLPKVALRGRIRIYAGSAPSQLKPKASGRLPYVKVDDLNIGAKYQSESREYVDEAPIVVPKGAVLFPKRGAAISNNKVRIATCDVCLDTNVMGVETLDGLDAEYFYYAITYERLYRIADTSTIPQLNNKHLNRCAIWIPEIHVQRRIANGLGELDKVLAILSQLVEAKRTFKRGLMQQLLTGQKRFPEFRDRPWRMHRFDHLCEELSDRNGNGLGPESVMGVIKGVGFEPMRDRVRGKGDLSRYKVVPPGGFAYNPMRLNIGSIAYNELGQTILVSPDYEVFRARPGLADPDFINQLRFSWYWSSFMDRAGAGSVRTRIYFTDLARLRVPDPEIGEQTRIAGVLDFVDSEIDQLAQLHELIEAQRRALLSRLLSGSLPVPV